MYLLVQMRLFKKKKNNFLLFYLFLSFSIFSQEEPATFDFLDKVEEQSLTEEKSTKVEEEKPLIESNPKKPIVEKKNKVKKTFKNKVKRKKTPKKTDLLWVDDVLFFEPKFEIFGLKPSNKNNTKLSKVDELKKVKVADKGKTSDSLLSHSIFNNQNLSNQGLDLLNFSDHIFNLMIEYRKAIIILVLILLLAFFRSRYLKKSSKSMRVSKDTIISNQILNSKRVRRKY